ncbi:hypothetical protein HYU19_02375 [Candidatus Woesearchaeota archaeon]|nr:hypothetical protein [Candidatus Woesearchaeota archaeon]
MSFPRLFGNTTHPPPSASSLAFISSSHTSIPSSNSTPAWIGQACKGRKGQSGTGAAVLVVIIAALIILYILFLPPAQRQAILEGREAGSGGVLSNTTLLLASPGRLDYLPQKDVEHVLPSVNLYTTTNAVILDSVQSAYVKNAWFDTSSKQMNFTVDDLGNTKNLLLSFAIRSYQGRLIVVLNGREIYNSDITSLSMPPIRLSQDLLLEHNTLEIQVSGVGAAFWRTNFFDLENIKITADVTDVATQEAQLSFLVSETERNNVVRVLLKFLPECTQDNAGVLHVYVNNHEIFSSVPDCGALRPLEFASHLLLNGENTLLFRTDKGPYLIDNINLKSELKQVTFPTFYFDIPQPSFDSLLARSKKAVLSLSFSNDVDMKKAELYINGHLRGFDVRSESYSLVIDPFVRKGNNVIEIRPKTTMDIVNMRVTLE